MRLHDKVGPLRDLRPDLAVLPECACPEVLLRRSPEIGASDMAWTGPNPAKGLAVLAFGPWRLTVAAGHNRKAATAAPLDVSGPARLRLLAVWALPRWARRQWDRAPEPVGEAIERSLAFLARTPAVIAGDFHQTLVRKSRGPLAPSPLARRLEALGFASVCRSPTYFPYRRPHRGYVADHVLLDRPTARLVRAVTIGGGSHWLSASDHLPVSIDLDLE
jgi:exodeoxyribonuclease-3